jgi:hypothetical protein
METINGVTAMPRPDYLFVSDSDGAMYDTRVDGWSHKPTLRPNFRRYHTRIKSTHDLKATLRNGAYAWGYPLYFVTSDGGTLSFEAVRSELRSVLDSIRNRHNDGWRIVACDINYEDTDLYCDHTGEKIEPAYGDNETTEES